MLRAAALYGCGVGSFTNTVKSSLSELVNLLLLFPLLVCLLENMLITPSSTSAAAAGTDVTSLLPVALYLYQE